MKYCPHCRRPSIQTAGACPHCGKNLEGAAAPPQDAEYSGLTALEDAVPLDTDSALPSISDAQEPSGIMLADGFGDLSPSGLELDAPPPQETPFPGDIPFEGTPLPSTPAPRLSPLPSDMPPDHTPLPSTPPRPSRPSSAHVSTVPDPFDVADLAGYGPRPTGIFDAVKYAFRVRQRSGELLSEAQRLEKSLGDAKATEQAALARLGERARVAGYTSSLVDPLLIALDAAEKDATGAEDALGHEKARHEQRLADIASRLDLIAQQMKSPRAVETTLAGQLAAKQDEKRRTQARSQRAEIEIRNANAVIAQGQADAQKAALAAEQEARLPTLEAQRAEAQTELSHLEEPIADLESQLQHLRQQIGELANKRKELIGAREEEQKSHRQAVKSASDQTEVAKKSVEAKLAEVGSLVRTDGPTSSWAEELYAGIDQRHSEVLRLELEHNRYQEAATSFDESAVKKGYIITAVCGGGVLLTILALIVVISTLS